MDTYGIVEWFSRMSTAKHKQIKKAYKVLRAAGVDMDTAMQTLYSADMARQRFELERRVVNRPQKVS